MKRDHNKMSGQPPKGKKEDGGGMDELLAVLGYKVKSSEMADVAQKLEQLDMAMGSFPTDGGAIPHLSDSVHYNPSDISSWIQSMLTELNPTPTPTAATTHPHPPSSSSSSSNPSPFFNHPPPSIINSTPNALFQDNSEYDIGAVVAGYSPRPIKSSPSSSSTSPSPAPINSNKRFKHNDPTPNTPPSTVTVTLGVGPPISDQSQSRPLVVVDSQEAGVRLVHTLMACAEAVQNDNLKVADALVKQIGLLAVSQAGAMRKVATYFAEGLARRIYKIRPDPSLTAIDAYASDVLQAHFYETCPYLQFAHFTANQAILEAFAGAKRVHVVDFSMKQGLQWPALIQALALRPGGPPVFRLTGIGPPQPDNNDALQEVGWKLAHFAKDLGVQFYYRGYVCDNLADLDPDLLDIRVRKDDQLDQVEEEEVVAVNSVCELHRLLARPGDIDRVMKNVRAMKPKIFTVAEQEANHNGPVFMERFNEALHYYSTMFDSLESYGVGGAGAGAGLLSESGAAAAAAATSQDRQLSEVYLGRQICNVVACEGAERVERHETLDQWRARFESAGFDPVHLGSNAFKQASMLLALYTGRDGYEVEENGGCLMLGWHKRALIATSAWR